MTESSDNPETPSGAPETPPPRPSPPDYYARDYPPPPPYLGFTPPPGPKNALGIASLVIAVITWVTLMFWFFIWILAASWPDSPRDYATGPGWLWPVVGGVILGIVAVVIGFAARGRVKRGEADSGGSPGIVLGFAAIIAGLAFIAIWSFFTHNQGLIPRIFQQ